MSEIGETLLAQAERHVREGQERISQQIELISRLENDGHDSLALMARELLATLTETQVAAHQHLERERARIAFSAKDCVDPIKKPMRRTQEFKIAL